jgi:hypothetical protein
MKTLSIELRDTYEIPNIIKELRNVDWETVLNFLDNVLGFTCRIGKDQSSQVQIDQLQIAIQQLERSKSDQLQILREDNKLLFEKKYQLQNEHFASMQTEYKTLIDGLNAEILNLRRNNTSQMDVMLAEMKIIYDKKISFQSNEMNQMEEKINKLIMEKSMMEKEIKHSCELIAKERQTELITSLEKEITYVKTYTNAKLMAENTELKHKLDMVTNQMTNELSSLANEITHRDEQISSLSGNILIMKNTNDMLEQLKTSIEPLNQFYSREKSVDRGSDGEAKVLEILNQYEDAIVNQVSSTPHSGDIWFIKGHLRVLIEVKNKKSITPDDVSKFISDVETSSGSINCGVLISLLTDKFPNRTREPIQVEYINSIPMVYLHLTNAHDMNVVLCMLQHLVKIDAVHSEDYYSSYYAHLSDTIDQYEKLIQVKTKEVKQLTKLKKECMDILSNLNDTNLPINAKQVKRDDVSAIINFKELTIGYAKLAMDTDDINVDTLAAYFKCPPSVLLTEHPSYDELVSKIKYSYVESQIKPNVLPQIKELFAKHGINLKKKELVYNLLITENTMRKLVRVVKEDLINVLHKLVMHT